jgi:hypothetical protein
MVCFKVFLSNLERFVGVRFKLIHFLIQSKKYTKAVSGTASVALVNPVYKYGSIAIKLIRFVIALMLLLFNLPPNPCVSEDLKPRM